MNVKSLAAAATIAVAAIALPAGAQAAEARLTNRANVRTGPGQEYPVVHIVRHGRRVQVIRCTPDWRWCEVARHRWRGWVWAGYLRDTRPRYQHAPIAQFGVQLGIPLFDWGREHHRDRRWDHDRDRRDHDRRDHDRRDWHR